jgi:hypothetical protein
MTDDLANLQRITELLREAREELERDLSAWERYEAELSFRTFLEALQSKEGK